MKIYSLTDWDTRQIKERAKRIIENAVAKGDKKKEWRKTIVSCDEGFSYELTSQEMYEETSFESEWLGEVFACWDHGKVYISFDWGNN